MPNQKVKIATLEESVTFYKEKADRWERECLEVQQAYEALKAFVETHPDIESKAITFDEFTSGAQCAQSQRKAS